MRFYNPLMIILIVLATEAASLKFSSVISSITEKRGKLLSGHNFLEALADTSLTEHKRMSFFPYLTHFAMTFSDVMDSWIYFEDPQTELEQRINTMVTEDNFHYNFFLNDMDTVSSYTLDRFGSYSAVMRHLWGDESKSFRQLSYTWILYVKKFDDPIVTLATLEAMESVFELTFKHIEKGGIKNYSYFGDTHMELELNHTQTNWFKEESEVSPLEDLDITATQMNQATEAAEQILQGYVQATML